MDKLINDFNSRWDEIKSVTLSAIRREINSGFDSESIVKVQKIFDEECKQWTEGRLNHANWFLYLNEHYPQKANKFINLIFNERLKSRIFSPTSVYWNYLITFILSVIVLISLCAFTELGAFKLIVVTIVVGMIFFAIGTNILMKVNNNYIKSFIQLYERDLEEERKKIVNILS